MGTTQISLFDGNNEFKIEKPIRLIELFAGYGSQSLALKYLGVNFEHYKICEWAVKSIQAYKDIHFPNDNTDYSKNLTFEEIIDELCKMGISANYNEPMSREQIVRMGEKKCRIVYNNIKATHNLVSVCNVHGEDLGIKDTDKYDYFLTYSFPCQDLSNAGLRKGMEKGSGTRSGLLWEVERMLDECEQLPKVLLMENVPEVIGTNNIANFADWVKKLDSLGYVSKWEILNAKDFGVPQNRNRCFMVSILGDYYYDFPTGKPLTKKLKDILEQNVDGSFYLSESKIKSISEWKAQQDPLKDIDKEKEISPCLTARGAGEEHSGMVLINENIYQNKMLIKNATKQGYLEAKEGDGVDLAYPDSKTRRGRVEQEMSQTVTTKDNLGVVVNDKYKGTFQYCKSDAFMQGKDRFKKDKEYSDTIQTTQKEGIVESMPILFGLRIRKLTPRECFRLMGVMDNDYDKVAKNQTNQSLYHLAGDSIVVNVLMAIFSQML